MTVGAAFWNRHADRYAAHLIKEVAPCAQGVGPRLFRTTAPFVKGSRT